MFLMSEAALYLVDVLDDGRVVRLFHSAQPLLVLESQLPHEIVNLLFTITNYNTQLTVL